MSNVQVKPFEGMIGADIDGVDLSKPMSQQVRNDIYQAWLDYQVLRFRNQELEYANLVDFSKDFGELDLAPISSSGEREIPEFPEILVVSNIKKEGKAIGSLGSYEAVWHTDMSYLEVPPIMTCLYAVEVPEQGGNTVLLNMYAAYDDLSDELKERISTLSCKHDYSRNSAGEVRKGYEQYADEKDVRVIPGALHPLVYTHPETKKKSLYLGRRSNAYIDGLSVEESEQLLNLLWEHATKDAYQWAQQWRVGDLLLWDNRCTMHRRDAFDDDSRRLLLRTQVRGQHKPS